MTAVVQLAPSISTIDRIPVSIELPQSQPSDKLPSAYLQRECARLKVLDADGKSVSFKSLYKDRRCMIIFIRHFFCGLCQDYLRSLVANISPQELASTSPPTSIAIIGCGQPELIHEYVSSTNCPFSIYADPTQKLYDVLDMKSSLDPGSRRPIYQRSPFAAMAIKSLLQSIGSGTNVLKGGPFSQMGGEFLFEDNRVSWCHKMRNTRDHTEAIDLKEVIGS